MLVGGDGGWVTPTFSPHTAMTMHVRKKERKKMKEIFGKKPPRENGKKSGQNLGEMDL